jgi:glucosamine-6-phosphate deaminase
MMMKSVHKEKSADIAHQQVGRIESTRYEKMHVEVFQSSDIGSIAIANEIASLIKEKEKAGAPCVLGLATGSSPIKVYNELVRLHLEEGLSFRNVVTFNLDEYYPMKKANTQSYHYFMHEHLFNHVDIDPKNIHIPSGTVFYDKVHGYCEQYERKIEAFGGIDFQLLGIGRTGHIGFNEPGSHPNSITRLVTLDYVTKADAATDFHGFDNVPNRAITMGMSTILSAKRIVLMAWGGKKSDIVKKAVEKEVTNEIPASYLQNHPNTTVLLDEESCVKLKRFKTPWLVGQVDWNEEMITKAVVWLSRKTGRTILKLRNQDYNNHGLSDILSAKGSAYDLNIVLHNKLQRTITGWPGGKPNADDTDRPERAEPARKRVILFSPHPDDDVISMGGTFLRLVNQGHDVHVVYQTSGNIAVADHDALRFAEFTKSFSKHLGEKISIDKVLEDIHSKTDGDTDSPDVRAIKGLIRRGEAIAAARYCGLKDENIHFLNMPFYETGRSKKNPLGSEDIELVKEIIERIKPHQIFAAGDLADPHGTHKVCLEAIFTAVEELKTQAFMDDCWLWLYRGAWLEWPIEEIEMAVPLSPDEVMRKRKAIFFHQSQKDGVLFQGEDSREFWQRAEDRNRDTAHRYNQLGLTEYEAIEAFVRHKF